MQNFASVKKVVCNIFSDLAISLVITTFVNMPKKFDLVYQTTSLASRHM